MYLALVSPLGDGRGGTAALLASVFYKLVVFYLFTSGIVWPDFIWMVRWEKIKK
jgi:hypothetical protein